MLYFSFHRDRLVGLGFLAHMQVQSSGMLIMSGKFTHESYVT